MQKNVNGQKPIAKSDKAPTHNGEPNGTLVSIEQTSSWSGPLPSPIHLEQYSAIVENGAERIFKAWEEESKHRRDLEKKELSWVIFESILGKIFALLFVIMALSLAAYSIYSGQSWVGAVLGSGVLASVVAAFVAVNRKQK